MKKKIFLFSLVLSALMCIFAISAFAANITVDHINYTTSGTNAYFYATDPTDGTLIEEITLPEKITYQGVEYNVVGTNRTESNNWPTDNTEINAIKKVILPATINTIANHTFRNYKGLEYVEFKGTITTFNDAEFYSCSALKEVKFANPDAVTKLGGYTFTSCSSLEALPLFNSVTVIGNNVFQYCSKIPEIAIPDCLTYIGSYAFNGTTCFTGADIVIPSGVTAVGAFAFQGVQIKSVKLSNIITRIEANTFQNTKIKEFTIPASVTSLDKDFLNGAPVEKIIVASTQITNFNNKNSQFNGTNSLKVVFYAGNEDSARSFASKIGKISGWTNYIPYTEYNPATSYTNTIVYGTPVCGGCSDIDTSKVSFDFISFTEKMYDRKACDKCGYVDTSAGVVEYAPILVIKGYTVEEGTNGSSMAYGFKVDKASLAKYQNETGITLSYGLIVGSTDGNTDGKIVDKDGNSLLNSAIAAKLSGASLEKFTIYNIKLTDIKTDNQKALPIFLCAYVISGEKVVYLGEDEKDFAVAISYNDINK